MGRKLSLFLFGILALAIGCRPLGADVAPPSLVTSDSPLALATFSSPLATFLSPVEAPLLFEGPVFSLDEPLSQGTIEVSGTAPIGIDILVVDITLMGEIIGYGQVGPDGRFSVSVQPPLIVNHRIGLTISAESVDNVDDGKLIAALESFWGDGVMAIPQVGMFFDTASVKP